MSTIRPEDISSFGCGKHCCSKSPTGVQLACNLVTAGDIALFITVPSCQIHENIVIL